MRLAHWPSLVVAGLACLALPGCGAGPDQRTPPLRSDGGEAATPPATPLQREPSPPPESSAEAKRSATPERSPLPPTWPAAETWSPETSPSGPAASARSDFQTFSDPGYAYSVRLPGTWQPIENLDGKVIRLSVVTPAGNRFIATVDRLPAPITRASRFEDVGTTYVTPVVEMLLRVFKLANGPRQTDDHSKADSLRFWQGTSSIGEEVGPAMMLSLHAVRFDSDIMVNLVYVSTNTSSEEVKAVDRIMDSLTFDEMVGANPG